MADITEYVTGTRFRPSEMNVPILEIEAKLTELETSTAGDQSANTVYSGPASGVDDTPSFRALVEDDIPAHGHDGSYYTETELSTPSSGAVVDWTNVANKPTLGTGDGDVVGPASNTDEYVPQWSGADSKTLEDGFPITAAGKAILDDTDAAAQRTTLGLGSIATYDIWTGTQSAYDALGSYDSTTLYLITGA